MEIQGVVKNIFIKIASKMGLELHEKVESKIDYAETGVNPTAIGAGVIANITIDDSDIIIDGNNARSDAIRKMAQYYTDEIETTAAEVSLGTGDCIIRPFTDGEHIGLNIIGNDNFIITDSIGYFLKGVIMKLDEYKTEKEVFRLFESQTLKENGETKAVYIKRFAYQDEKEVNIEGTNWKGISTEENITADQLIIGRIKCPTINRDDYNSANGVPITFGCEEIIENIKTKYRQYNDEFDRKQALIFADRTMFKSETREDGSKKYSLDGREFLKVRGDVEGNVSNMIQDYSPDIREAEFQSGNNFNLSVLELCCGFSRGVFTAPETAFATATEMKNSLKKTFSFVKRFRRRIENGNEMLFHAIDIIMNLNSTTPMGDWDIRHNWSYDYIEETRERFNQLLQMNSIGAVDSAEVRAWGMNEDIETARTEVMKIGAERQETDDITDE